MSQITHPYYLDSSVYVKPNYDYLFNPGTKSKVLYLDLDGVLADMQGFVVKTFGSLAEINKPNWGRIGIEFPDLYSLLEPLPEAHLLWDYCNKHFKRVEILTALPKRCYMPEAANDKRDWVYRHFGKGVRVNFGPYAFDKQFYATPESILIDDMSRNIEQWRSRGGIGIQHVSTLLTLLELEQYV